VLSKSPQPSASVLSTRSTPILIDDATATPSSTETPHPTALCAKFELQWDRLWHESKKLKNPHYRLMNKRQIGTQLQPSWIFQHGADIEDEEGTRYFICQICHLSRAYHKGVYVIGSTSHAKAHLRKHEITKPGVETPDTERSQSTIQAYNLVAPFDHEQYKKDYIDWIMLEDITFRQASSERTTNLMINGGPLVRNLLPHNAGVVSEWVRDSYEARRKQVKDILGFSKSKINISSDVWKAGNGYDYCGVVGHWIGESLILPKSSCYSNWISCLINFTDDDCKLRTALLGFPRLVGPHSGENIAACVTKVIRAYDIGHNIGAFMMDNAHDNDGAVKELAWAFGLNEDQVRLRCIGNIINLIVKALLFGKGVSKLERELCGASDKDIFKIWSKKGPIGKVHNLCNYVNRNDQRRERFNDLHAEAAGDDDVFFYQLLRDGGVRWNAVYDMIKRGKLHL